MIRCTVQLKNLLAIGYWIGQQKKEEGHDKNIAQFLPFNAQSLIIKVIGSVNNVFQPDFPTP